MQQDLHTSIQVWRKHTGLPCAMALRLIRFRPGDRLSCHHHQRRTFVPAHLTPAPGRRTQTISPYASGRARQSQPSRPPLPAPTSATMAYAPLVGQDGGSYGGDLGEAGSGMFFARGLDEWNRAEIVRQFNVFA